MSWCLLSRDTDLRSARCQTVSQWWSGVCHLLPTCCVCVLGSTKLSASVCLLRHCLKLSCTTSVVATFTAPSDVSVFGDCSSPVTEQ